MFMSYISQNDPLLPCYSAATGVAAMEHSLVFLAISRADS
jgi:hypothetical protein